MEYAEVSETTNNFKSSIEVLRRETNLLNGCDRDVAKYYYINNVCDLEDKSPENVAGFIKYRFFKRQIYTWAGQTLIAVQPYETIPTKKELKDNEPTISAVVSRAWFRLSNKLGKNNQSIVISGDSGSGKTYSACVALRHLGSQPHICDQETLSKVLYKVWSSVPVLAAFGNASTIHNNNSSRFGRLIQIQCRNGKIVGAFIQTFLLERSRVSGPNRSESNFHIFNQILGDLDETAMDKIYLSKTIDYKICPKMPHLQCCPFSDVVEAMKYLNITKIDEILRILSLILNLGNIDFSAKDNKLTIIQECKQYVNFSAKILQCSTSSLTQLFVRRLVSPKLRRGSMCYTPCINTEECQERKNSLMRFLYDKLFNWLVDKINKQIYCNLEHDCLGILDIYGFEVFHHNTFEQLCINYANERLQQYFVNDYYNKQVNYLYEKCEKITTKYDMSKYNNRISLLDGTMSVFGLLNEECAVKRYNTDTYIRTRLSNHLKKHESFIDPTDSRSTKFSIKHYAGIVEYDCRSMLNKNRDKIPEEFILLLNETKLEILSEMVDPKHEEFQYLKSRTLLTKFKKSLDNLMTTLNKCDVHYIKCLKPNKKQIPDYFDIEFFIEQMKYNGIKETINLEFQMFSTIISKADFYKRFDVQIISELKNILKGKMFIGRDKIYFTENSFSTILKYKTIVISSSVRKIQKFWRARTQNRHKAASKIQNFFRRLLQTRQLNLNETNDTFDEITVIENINFNPDVSNDSRVKETEDKKIVSRIIFRNDGIASRQRIAQVPVRFHIRRTCIPFSHILPKEESPSGLCDIF